MGSLGERIREMREALSLSQSAFAQKIGVNPKSGTMSETEKGGRTPTVEQLLSICGVAAENGFNLKWLLLGIDAEEKKDVPGVSGLSGQEVSLLGLFRDLPDDAHRDMVFGQVRAAVDALSGSACCAAPKKGEKKEESHASSRGKVI